MALVPRGGVVPWLQFSARLGLEFQAFGAEFLVTNLAPIAIWDESGAEIVLQG